MVLLPLWGSWGEVHGTQEATFRFQSLVGRAPVLEGGRGLGLLGLLLYVPRDLCKKRPFQGLLLKRTIFRDSLLVLCLFSPNRACFRVENGPFQGSRLRMLPWRRIGALFFSHRRQPQATTSLGQEILQKGLCRTVVVCLWTCCSDYGFKENPDNGPKLHVLGTF